jgi:hypothetical protein
VVFERVVRRMLVVVACVLGVGPWSAWGAADARAAQLSVRAVPGGRVSLRLRGPVGPGAHEFRLDGRRLSRTRRRAITVLVARRRGAGDPLARWRVLKVRRAGSRRVLARARFAMGVSRSRAAPTLVLLAAPPPRTTSTRAVLRFSVSSRTASCDRDGSRFRACSSPIAYNGLSSGSHSFRIRAANRHGTTRIGVASTVLAPSSRTPPPPTPTPTPTRSGDHILTAVGDYTSSSSNANDIAVKNAVIAANPELHLGIGDFQYTYISSIYSGFDAIWGPKPNGLWGRIRPAGGPTHDVSSCSDLNYQNYWNRPVMKGYSFDLGAWHVVSLPSAAVRYGCDVAGITSWLKSDLAASSTPCTLAFWQDPYWTRPTATHTRENGVKPWVQALYDANADVVLQASNHDYQRFSPQNMLDQRDNARGIRAFVVGTGGIGLYTFTGGAPNVEASDDTTYGTLKMVLRPTGYDFEFIRAAGGTFTDSGSGVCH